jgi:hypothetical protein
VLAIRRASRVSHDGLRVGPGGGRQAGAAPAQEAVGLPHGDQRGGDGAGRVVLAIKVPLEGSDEVVRAEWAP